MWYLFSRFPVTMQKCDNDFEATSCLTKKYLQVLFLLLHSKENQNRSDSSISSSILLIPEWYSIIAITQRGRE